MALRTETGRLENVGFSLFFLGLSGVEEVESRSVVSSLDESPAQPPPLSLVSACPSLR